ncbi:MAG: anti-sigma factor antagonist [Gemmataceae bacterium]|nr:anti-sigma factor antagonist [Gemmataceae bacterium]
MISAQTPEGELRRCPVCGQPGQVDSPADSLCDHCGNVTRFENQASITITLASFPVFDQKNIEVFTRVRDIVNDVKPTELLLDFQNVKYLSSSAFGRLLSVLKELNKSSCQVVVCNLEPAIKGIFQITRADQLVKMQEAE